MTMWLIHSLNICINTMWCDSYGVWEQLGLFTCFSADVLMLLTLVGGAYGCEKTSFMASAVSNLSLLTTSLIFLVCVMNGGDFICPVCPFNGLRPSHLQRLCHRNTDTWSNLLFNILLPDPVIVEDLLFSALLVRKCQNSKYQWVKSLLSFINN